MSSTFNKESNEPVFDINKRKKGGVLDGMIDAFSSENSPEMKSKYLSNKKYLNCFRFANLSILMPSALIEEREIVIEGLFEKEYDKWEYGTKNIN